MGAKIDPQTTLNIILGFATLYLAIRNFAIVNKKEVARESNEMTEIRVQLTQVMSMLQDLQRDVRSSSADFRAMSERVAVIETNLNTAFKRIDELRGAVNGQAMAMRKEE